jgi:hypothetical protein
MNNIKRFLSFALIFVVLFSFNVASYAFDDQVQEAINGYTFLQDEIHSKVVQSELESDVSLCNFKIQFNENLETISADIMGDITYNYKGEIELYQSNMQHNLNNVIVGKDANNDDYSIINFRLEKVAESITLLKPNLALEGKTVLNLAIANKHENKIYYFQIEIKDINFDSIYNSIKSISYKTDDEELSKMEMKQMTFENSSKIFGIDNKTSSVLKYNLIQDEKTGVNKMDILNDEDYETINIEEDTFNNLAQQTKELGRLHYEDLKTRSLLTSVPDSIFKSGEFDKGHFGGDSWNSRRYYYYPMRFAGTDNRLTYVMSYTTPDSANNSIQEYDLSFKVRDNVWVLYNVYNEELGIFDERGRIEADAKITYKIKSSDTKGVFTRRYYTYVRGAYDKKNIYKLVVGYIPYANEIDKIYSAITAKSETATHKWFPWEDNYEEQKADEYIVKEVTVEAKDLKKTNDYLYLKLKGDHITSTPEASYSVTMDH